tara:strand:- start:2666 stop:3004 length:339 start_codon:yes stop_codon:yes gene_type:complete
MSAIEKAVIAKILKRAAKGKSKYGVTMEREDLSTLDWLRHAQEEAMDLAVYLQRLIEEEENTMRCESCGAHREVHECWSCNTKRCVNCDMDEMRTDEDGHTYCHDCVMVEAV